MPKFLYQFTVECETVEQAERVVAERMGHDEDYGFEYKVSMPRLAHVRQQSSDASAAILDAP